MSINQNPALSQSSLAGAEALNDGPDESQEDKSGGGAAMSEAQVLGWVLALTALSVLLGMRWGLLVFIMAYMRVTARETWFSSALVSISTVLSIHLIFIEALGARLHPGIIIRDYLPQIWAAISGG